MSVPPRVPVELRVPDELRGDLEPSAYDEGGPVFACSSPPVRWPDDFELSDEEAHEIVSRAFEAAGLQMPRFWMEPVEPYRPPSEAEIRRSYLIVMQQSRRRRDRRTAPWRLALTGLFLLLLVVLLSQLGH